MDGSTEVELKPDVYRRTYVLDPDSEDEHSLTSIIRRYIDYDRFVAYIKVVPYANEWGNAKYVRMSPRILHGGIDINGRSSDICAMITNEGIISPWLPLVPRDISYLPPVDMWLTSDIKGARDNEVFGDPLYVISIKRVLLR